MADSTLRLAKKLSKLGHPVEWVKFYESHSPYEWAIQIACEQVEPTGEDRADLRHAINTRNIVAASATSIDASQYSELLDELRFYLKVHEFESGPVGPAAVRNILGG